MSGEATDPREPGGSAPQLAAVAAIPFTQLLAVGAITGGVAAAVTGVLDRLWTWGRRPPRRARPPRHGDRPRRGGGAVVAAGPAPRRRRARRARRRHDRDAVVEDVAAPAPPPVLRGAARVRPGGAGLRARRAARRRP